jgi:hypothetical protein
VQIVLAFACVAVMSAFGKAAKDVPTAILVLFQNFISLMLFTPWALGKSVSELRTIQEKRFRMDVCPG